MLTLKQKQSIREMVEQAVVAAEFQFKCTDPDLIERAMRKSILKTRPEALEYAVKYMRAVIV